MPSSQTPRTFNELLRAFGESRIVSDYLGVSRWTAYSWRNREYIPPEHWAALVRLAKLHDIPGVTTDLLAGFVAGRSVRRQQSRERPRETTLDSPMPDGRVG